MGKVRVQDGNDPFGVGRVQIQVLKSQPQQNRVTDSYRVIFHAAIPVKVQHFSGMQPVPWRFIGGMTTVLIRHEIKTLNGPGALHCTIQALEPKNSHPS